MTSIAETFEHFRQLTDDVPAVILAVGSVLAGEQVAAKSLTVNEAAKLLRVSADSVYALCETGKLKDHRIGNGRGTIRILPADLIRLQRTAA
jgi:excisionase family DNA binding protein